MYSNLTIFFSSNVLIKQVYWENKNHFFYFVCFSITDLFDLICTAYPRGPVSFRSTKIYPVINRLFSQVSFQVKLSNFIENFAKRALFHQCAPIPEISKYRIKQPCLLYFVRADGFNIQSRSDGELQTNQHSKLLFKTEKAGLSPLE